MAWLTQLYQWSLYDSSSTVVIDPVTETDALGGVGTILFAGANGDGLGYFLSAGAAMASAAGDTTSVDIATAVSASTIETSVVAPNTGASVASAGTISTAGSSASSSQTAVITSTPTGSASPAGPTSTSSKTSEGKRQRSMSGLAVGILLVSVLLG